MKRWTTSVLLVAAVFTGAMFGAGIAVYLHPAIASRNSAGTYSLATSPVTTLQTISTSLWNNTFSDLATGVTDSLDRNGRGGMLAALRGIDGTVAAPAFAYTSETGSGEYRIGAGDLGWAILGGKKLELTSSLFTVTPNAGFTGVLLGSNGAVGAPSYSFTNDATAGLYRAGGADFRFAVSGVDVSKWTAGVFSVSPTSSGATPGANGVANFEKNSATGISILSPNANSVSLWMGDVANSTRGGIDYFNSANANADQMRFNTNGTERGRFSNSGFAAGGSQQFTVGTTGNVGTTGTFTVGSGGTATSQINFGSCVTNAGTPSVCTATVASGAKCVANLVGTSASTDSVTTSVSSTTLTITVQNGVAKTANYICF